MSIVDCKNRWQLARPWITSRIRLRKWTVSAALRTWARTPTTAPGTANDAAAATNAGTYATSIPCRLGSSAPPPPPPPFFFFRRRPARTWVGHVLAAELPEPGVRQQRELRHRRRRHERRRRRRVQERRPPPHPIPSWRNATRNLLCVVFDPCFSRWCIWLRERERSSRVTMSAASWCAAAQPHEQ